MKYKVAQRRKKPEARLRAMMAACQGMRECPFTGNGLPKYRLDGTRIMMEFPKPKADDDMPPDQTDLKQVPLPPRGAARCHAGNLHPLGALVGSTGYLCEPVPFGIGRTAHAARWKEGVPVTAPTVAPASMCPCGGALGV